MNPIESHGDQPERAAQPLSPDDRVQRREGVILRHVAGEHMLVPAVTGSVDLDCLFLLNATGMFVWDRLNAPRQVRELCEAVARAFSIDLKSATGDVTAFLSRLLEQNLAAKT